MSHWDKNTVHVLYCLPPHFHPQRTRRPQGRTHRQKGQTCRRMWWVLHLPGLNRCLSESRRQSKHDTSCHFRQIRNKSSCIVQKLGGWEDTLSLPETAQESRRAGSTCPQDLWSWDWNSLEPLRQVGQSQDFGQFCENAEATKKPDRNLCGKRAMGREQRLSVTEEESVKSVKGTQSTGMGH